jgi:Tol biopolymer transport system component
MPPGCSAVYRPAFSPDGRLAAICDSGEGANLYAQDASGRFVEVPTTGEPTGDPTWAGPNEIIFLQRVGDGPRELYSIQSDGSRQRKLVDGSARRPDWCASGGLVFLQAANDEDEGGTVALLPPGRVTPRPINSFGRQVLSATWSPDCRELALVVGNAPPGQQIVIADATAPFTVTRRFGLPDGATASQPAWGSR